MTYKEWLNIWLENYVKPSAKAKTIERYESIVQKQINGVLGEKEISAITATDIRLFVTELLKSGNRTANKGLAASSVNTVITVIQSSLKTAVGLGYIQKNVAAGIKRPKIKDNGITCFTVAEQKKIEEAALSDKRSKMFGIVLCLYTGLRLGELLALTWADVDLQKGFITVNKTCHDGMTEHGFDRILDEPKTQSSRRTVPVPKQLLPILRKLEKTEKNECVVSFHGHPLTIRSYQRSFALLLEKIGVEHKNFRSLRHTFAMRALECGMDVKTLSEILGYKNATGMLNRYVNSLTEHKKMRIVFSRQVQKG